MKKLITAISLFVAPTIAFAAGDPVAGKAKSASCVACHGPAGISTAPIYPNLAGQHAVYLLAQLKAFKNGERKNPSMAPMIAPLSDKDMEDLAAYYESLGKASSGSGGDAAGGRRRR